MDIITYIFIFLLVVLVLLVILINIKVRKDIKSGLITKQDIEEAEEDHRIW